MDNRPQYLLDTGILLALVRGNPFGDSLNHRFRLSETLTRTLISIVTHGEIWAMAERNRWGGPKREALRSMLDDLITMDLDAPAIIDSYVAVDIKNQSHPGGARALSNNDMWIAATARASGALLLTGDRDFLHLHPDVCRVQYVDEKDHPRS